MKKSVSIVLMILLCLLFLPACGNGDDGQTGDKRTVDFAAIYEEATQSFSLDGYSPGTTRTALRETDGFLQNEPVVFHGLAANVSYAFDRERLSGVTYVFSTTGMTDGQWAEAVAQLYDNLSIRFDSLPAYKTGVPGGLTPISCVWYANAGDRMSMLGFSADPGGGSDPSASPSIAIAIVTDLPDAPSATTSYRAHFKPADDEMVNVSHWIPGVYVDLMYATADNFTGKVIYGFSSAYLRYGTVEKLIGVQKKLNQQGYSLKVCDAFRPVAAQFILWDAVPDPDFVADPYHGYSTHSRGNTVDLTLVTVDGATVEMPTEVDTFSPKADRDYSDVSAEAAKHAMVLQKAMVDAGFKTSSVEWWHYYDTISYPVAKEFTPPQ